MKQMILFLFTILSLKNVMAADLMIKIKAGSEEALKTESKVLKAEKLLNFGVKEFDNVYKVDIQGNVLEAQKLLESKDYILDIETVIEAEFQSVFPKAGTDTLNNDPLSIYQWGLKNQEQVILAEKDLYTSLPVVGKPGQDIGLPGEEVLSSMKKDIVVAVLDSGIDPKHNDLVKSFALNKAECESNDPEVDADNNGLKADCLGWNFSVHYSDPRARILKDENGHGTHVAGIIGAQSGNATGISGVSNRIKILPLKVLRSKRLRVMSDVLTEAILYSVRRKVDVINFSMGWSRSLDSKNLRGAIQVAINNGVTVVAAAGNNSSNDSIYPCAYDRVICVGATKVNGQFANFSNFGGNVDLLAPGESILSTIPRQFIPTRFPIFGYDLKNGTSQASPMVAAAVAVLKGMNPEITNNEIYARLALSAGDVPEDLVRSKFTNFGLVNIEKALQQEKKSLIMPNFKVVKQILFNPKTKKFILKIPVKNFWESATDIKINISHNLPHVQLVNTEITIDQLEEGQAKQITLLGDILDISEESLIKLNFDITANGETKRFTHEIPILRQILGPGTIAKPIVFNGSPKPLAIIREGHIHPIISTVDDKYHILNYPHYYLTKNKDDIFTLILFKQNAREIREAQKTFTVNNLEKLVSFESLDLNYDGKPDFLIQTIEKVEDQSVFAYYYLDTNMNPLFEGVSKIIFRPKFAIATPETIRFRKHTHTELGPIALPIFVENGRTPLWNQNLKTYWDVPDMSIASHIYYFDLVKEEGEMIFKEHVLDTKDFQEKFRADNKIKDTYEISYLTLTQSQKDYNEGITKIISQSVLGFEEINNLLTLKDSEVISTDLMKNNFEHLVGRVHNKVVDLSGNKITYNADDIFSSFYTQTKLELLFLGSEKKEIKDSLIYENPESTDHILGYLSSFKDEKSFTTFYQTRSNILVLRRSENETKVFKRRLLRFSFLPGNILNELYYPIATQSGDRVNPALYIDGTSITLNRIHVLEAKEDKVISPIRFNMVLPAACKAMNPVKYSGTAVSSYSFVCLNKEKKWNMLYHPLK